MQVAIIHIGDLDVQDSVNTNKQQISSQMFHNNTTQVVIFVS